MAGVSVRATNDPDYPDERQIDANVSDVRDVIALDRVGARMVRSVTYDNYETDALEGLVPKIAEFDTGGWSSRVVVSLGHYEIIQTLLKSYKPTFWSPQFHKRAPYEIAGAAYTFAMCSVRSSSPVSLLDSHSIIHILSFLKTSDWFIKL
jgi:hypothetical protein